METAPTGTEIPQGKRNLSLNYLSVHFKKTEIPFPWSLLSVLSLWPVQSGEQLINLVLVCDGAICFLVSASLLIQGKVEQILRTVSFQGRCLPYLFFTVLKEHWWVPFNLSVPKPLRQHSQTATHHLTPMTYNWKATIFSIKERLGVLHSQTSYLHRDFPWAIITGSWRAPKSTQDHVVLRTVKNTSREAPAILKALTLETGQMTEKEGKPLHSNLEAETNPCRGRDIFDREDVRQWTLVFWLSTRSWRALD